MKFVKQSNNNKPARATSSKNSRSGSAAKTVRKGAITTQQQNGNEYEYGVELGPKQTQTKSAASNSSKKTTQAKAKKTNKTGSKKTAR